MPAHVQAKNRKAKSYCVDTPLTRSLSLLPAVEPSLEFAQRLKIAMSLSFVGLVILTCRIHIRSICMAEGGYILLQQASPELWNTHSKQPRQTLISLIYQTHIHNCQEQLSQSSQP